MERIYLKELELNNRISTIRRASVDYAYCIINDYQESFTIVFEENKISVKTMRGGMEEEVLEMSYTLFEYNDVPLRNMIARIKNLFNF